MQFSFHNISNIFHFCFSFLCLFENINVKDNSNVILFIYTEMAIEHKYLHICKIQLRSFILVFKVLNQHKNTFTCLSSLKMYSTLLFFFSTFSCTVVCRSKIFLNVLRLGSNFNRNLLIAMLQEKVY